MLDGERERCVVARSWLVGSNNCNSHAQHLHCSCTHCSCTTLCCFVRNVANTNSNSPTKPRSTPPSVCISQNLTNSNSPTIHAPKRLHFTKPEVFSPKTRVGALFHPSAFVLALRELWRVEQRLWQSSRVPMREATGGVSS